MLTGTHFVLTKTYYNPIICQFTVITDVVEFEVMTYTSFSTPVSEKRRQELTAQIAFTRKSAKRS